MPKKSKYDLKNAQLLNVPKTIWDELVKQYGEDAPEEARYCLELFVGMTE